MTHKLWVSILYRDKNTTNIFHFFDYQCSFRQMFLLDFPSFLYIYPWIVNFCHGSLDRWARTGPDFGLPSKIWSSGVWWFGGTITTAKWSTGRQSWSTFFDHRCCIPGNPIWIESLYRWRYHTSIWAWLRWSQNYVTYLNYVRVLYRAFHYVPISDFVCTWVTITLSFRIKKKLYKTVDNMSDNDKMTSERLSDFLILP